LLPKRTRLFSQNYILDIVEADYGQKLYYYTVHHRVSGEIVTLGHELSAGLARASALRSFHDLTGEELLLEEDDGSPSVA
jgi:hypothetical protein